MAENWQFEIITPRKKIMEGEAAWITIPGEEGELGVLPQHVPLMTTMGSGILKFESGGKINQVAVHYGYAQIQGNRVTILSEMAERAEDIDLTRAQNAEKKAREILQELITKQTDEENRLAKFEAKLKRAIVRQSMN